MKFLNFINGGVKFSKNAKVCKLNNIYFLLNNTFLDFHGMEKRRLKPTVAMVGKDGMAKLLPFNQLPSLIGNGINLVSEKEIDPKGLVVMLKDIEFFSINMETTNKGCYLIPLEFKGMLATFKDDLTAKLSKELLPRRKVDHMGISNVGST